MSSFNTYGSRSLVVGNSVPVWLGTVTPLPGGFKVVDAQAGMKIPAGSPISCSRGSGSANPIFVYSVSSGSGSTSLTLAPLGDYGSFVPTTDWYVSTVGSDGAFAPVVVSAVSVASDGTLSLTSASAITASYVVLIPNTDYEGINGYSYNDVAIDADDENPQATVAVVVAHNEGILIDRTPCAKIDAQMATAVPNVIQVFK